MRTNELDEMLSCDGTVVQVHPGGTFARYDRPDKPLEEYAPSVMMTTGDDGQIMPEHTAQFVTEVEATGWTLEKGWSGQYLTRGDDPGMHMSEFVGGGLKDHILDTPGLWCVMPLDVESEECPNETDGCKLSDPCDTCVNGDGHEREIIPVGWVVMHRDARA